MAKVSFLSLPVEVIHRIFDFLNFETILFSIRCICKRLENIVNEYNRLHVSVTSKHEKILKSLLPILRPENVMELSLTNKSYTNMLKTFCSVFSLGQFNQLSSLNLRQIRNTDFEQILKNLNTKCLTSIHLEFNEEKHVETWKLISSLVSQANIRNLSVPNIDYTTEHISWPIQYGLQKLIVNNCNLLEYFTILNQLPSLRTLVMNKCSANHTNWNSSQMYPKIIHTSLKSLSINDSSLSPKDFEILLESIPELRHLKLINKYRNFDSMFDGNHWEQIIRTKVLHLEKLEMFISCFNKRDGTTHRIEPIIETFATPFWLIEKQWIVYCSLNISGSSIYLYTMPIDIQYGKVFRYEVSSIDQTCRLTSRDFNTSIEVKMPDEDELFLRRESIDSRGAQYLSTILQNDSTIKKLDLGQNCLKEKGLQYLSDVLSQNTRITTLSLHDNEIGNNGAKFIENILKQNKTLTSLDLGENAIENIGIEYLCNGLRENTTLIKLNLGNNQIGDKGVEYLADILKNNNTLIELNLTTNRISEHEARHLADALKKNTTLTRLCLGDNSIGDAGTKYLAEGLNENTTLITLELGKNKIGNQGAKHLADVLHHNTTLTTLDLQVNQIDDQGAQFLIDALKQNQTIQVLTFYNNQLSYKLKENFSSKNSRIRC